MTATFTVPAVIAEIYPTTVRTILEHGHEVAAHGFKHEDVSQLDKDQEWERIEAATASLTRLTGQRPVGWYSCPASAIRLRSAPSAAHHRPAARRWLRVHG